MFVGAVAFGRIADRIGRRRAFLISLVWFSVWSAIGAVAPNPWILVGSRFMAGIGVGAECPVADSYLSDVLPKAHRGRLTAWAYTCSFLAVPALGFLSLSLNGRNLFGFEGWRVLLLVGAIGECSSSCCAVACRSRRGGWRVWVGSTTRGPHCGRSNPARHRHPPLTAMKTMTSRPRRSRFGPRQRFNDCGFRPTGSGSSCSACFISSSPSAITDSARWRCWSWSVAATTSPRRCCSRRCRSSAIRSGHSFRSHC